MNVLCKNHTVIYSAAQNSSYDTIRYGIEDHVRFTQNRRYFCRRYPLE